MKNKIKKINLELKRFCDDFAPIRVILEKKKAKNFGTVFQKDYFFNLLDNSSSVKPRLKLRLENNKQTLIFYKRKDFKEKNGAPADILLYEVKDDKLLDFLRKTLGVMGKVEKTRERWRKGNVVFNLDEVHGVGNVFEIEAEIMPGSKKRDEELFKQYENEFLKYLGDVIKGSNVDLVNKL